MARVELPPRCAIRRRRSWGYVLGGREATPRIPKNPYLLPAVLRIAYIREGESDFFFVSPGCPNTLRTAVPPPVLPLRKELRWLACLCPLLVTTSTLASARVILPHFRNGDPTASDIRRSHPMWTLVHGLGRPCLRLGRQVSSPKGRTPELREFVPNARYSKFTGAIRGGGKHTWIQTYVFLVFFLRLDLGGSGLQLPGRPEPPHKSGDDSSNAEIRESHAAEETPRYRRTSYPA